MSQRADHEEAAEKGQEILAVPENFPGVEKNKSPVSRDRQLRDRSLLKSVLAARSEMDEVVTPKKKKRKSRDPIKILKRFKRSKHNPRSPVKVLDFESSDSSQVLE